MRDDTQMTKMCWDLERHREDFWGQLPVSSIAALGVYCKGFSGVVRRKAHKVFERSIKSRRERLADIKMKLERRAYKTKLDRKYGLLFHSIKDGDISGHVNYGFFPDYSGSAFHVVAQGRAIIFTAIVIFVCAPGCCFSAARTFPWRAKMFFKKALFATAAAGLSFAPMQAQALELVIGEERVKPGIVFIFEGAIKDHVAPLSMHLAEKETHVHIEARVNWDEKNIPEGTPPGGFVPYLHVTARVTNEKTGLSTFVDLTPHINLVDNFHYARNIALPGAPTDKYSVQFNVVAPAQTELALHRDWLDGYGETLMKGRTFRYKGVDFAEIAKASRR